MAIMYGSEYLNKLSEKLSSDIGNTYGGLVIVGDNKFSFLKMEDPVGGDSYFGPLTVAEIKAFKTIATVKEILINYDHS